MKKLLETITGKRLMERWEMDEHELFQVIKDRGIKVYKSWIDPSYERKGYTKRELIRGIQDVVTQLWGKPEGCDFVDSYGSTYKMVHYFEPDEIPSLIFKMSDIEKFENDYETGRGEDSPKPRNEALTEKTPNAFCRNGRIWEVRFKGKQTTLINLERARYIAHILDKPNRQFYPLELTALVKKITPEIDEAQKEYSKLGEEGLEKERLSLVDIEIPGLSEREKDGLEDKIHNLWDKGNKQELEILRKHMFNEYGVKVMFTEKGPRFEYLPQLTNEAEKARVNVKKHIKNAIEDIKKDIPELGEHLTTNITTGKIISYNNQEEAYTWEIIF